MAKDEKREPRWQLAKLRRMRGFSQLRLATAIGVAHQTVSRWETGTSEVDLDNLQPLADALDVPLDRLYKILRNEDEELNGEPKNNGSDDLAKLIPEWLSVYTAMEQSASKIEAFEPHVVHGLLQTRDYARALVYLSDYARQDADRVKRLVDLRMSRRSVLSREHNALRLNAILSETALRTVAGDHEVMRAQLAHLLTMSERGNVTIRILPFAAGPHTASYGPFAFFTVPWDEESRQVYVESYITEGSYLKTQHYLEHFTSLWERLNLIALSPDDSIKLIKKVMEDEYE